MAIDENVVGQPELLAELTPEQAERAEHRRILVIIGALMLGIGLASLDQTIVATALPDHSAALAEVLKMPDVLKRMQDMGDIEPIGSTPAQMGAYMQVERARWAAVIHEIGLKGD